MLGKTAKVYEYIRRTLSVPMHGRENSLEFAGEEGKLRETIGGYVSVIYHSLRNGDVSKVSVHFPQLTGCSTIPFSSTQPFVGWEYEKPT